MVANIKLFVTLAARTLARISTLHRSFMLAVVLLAVRSLLSLPRKGYKTFIYVFGGAND